MKIGVVSDTHDQIKRIEKAVEVFNKEGVGLVVHCGDIISPFTLQLYKKLRCPMKALFGNNTGDIALHFESMKKHGVKNVEFSNVPFMSLEFDGRKIAVYHGDVPQIVDALIKSRIYDCVFSGHDHIPGTEEFGGVLSLKPGTLLDKYEEGMSDKPSVAIYDTKTNKARIVYL